MTGRRLTGAMGALLPLLLAAMPALAADAEPPKLDSGDTAWMLASTALVLLMTVPGLALFYGGMVRKKNILATLMQCFVITCIVTIVWTVAGYSLAFTRATAVPHLMSATCRASCCTASKAHIGKGAYTEAGFILGAGSDGATPHDDPRDRLHDVPDDLRDHHAGADRGRLRGPHEVLGAVHLHDAVVAADLFADRALGVGADRLGVRSTASSTSPAARWCISTPASPA